MQIEANITAYVCFDGAASVRRVSEGGDVIVSFPDRTPLTLAFRSRVRAPTERLTVPPTAAGVATAVTHASGALATRSPDRSYPSLRGHPPAIDLGERSSVPDSLADRAPDTGIRLRVPDDLGSVFVLAPLAYYLQSSVVVEDRPAPRLEAPAVGVARDLDPPPALQHRAADLLYRAFML